MHYVTRRETFNAAHKLALPTWSDERNREVFGKCANANWHGHNYDLRVTVSGSPDPVTGFVMDAKVLSQIIKRTVVDVLDHSNLNLDVDWFRDRLPTTENLTTAIWERLVDEVSAAGSALYRVRLYETENIYADYYGPAGRP
ncbi:6-pyruvoyltetrahydropterin/6-carboxytetrahydropterin synthase [Neolewinella xylanilytica]|uniref:6-carboxy-5,6,7,8-tetrahydropterin synthase n=1 Tax=Neolewinella xylanilytica TaxID=1514080 RepID=A0A2S6I0D9_9BACT|nr:6-carboxytetrahydropterin synthase [Neolewinella xylanilytica]PPK84318.1 6-pyruvoyltetrahydropterin/6-carboxytetrahydropterin synthase [Neolewinella xylanilytica]